VITESVAGKNGEAAEAAGVIDEERYALTVDR